MSASDVPKDPTQQGDSSMHRHQPQQDNHTPKQSFSERAPATLQPRSYQQELNRESQSTQGLFTSTSASGRRAKSPALQPPSKSISSTEERSIYAVPSSKSHDCQQAFDCDQVQRSEDEKLVKIYANAQEREAKDDVRGLKEELDRMGGQLSAANLCLDQSRALASDHQRELRVLEKAKEDLRRELEHTRNQLSVVNQDLDKSRALAECRRKELRVLEKYLTTADTAAASDVRGGVERLNAMIKHESANMLSGGFKDLERDFQAEYQDVRKHLYMDARLVDALRGDLGDDESFIIRTALRATLVVWVEYLASLWSFTANREFIDTYQKIYQAEDQSIAGKWRSLSRAQMSRDSTESRTHIATTLLAVFIVAGFDRDEAKARIDKCAEGINRIVRAALDLNRLIGEQITSADFGVYFVQPGEQFDLRSMENIEREPQQGRVLCTSALGLYRREGRPKPQIEIAIKPQVLVDYVLNDLRTG